MPDGFVFALKAPRFAAHRKKLAKAGDSISRFIDRGVARLGDKLGPINWQFVATKAFDRPDYEACRVLLPPSVKGLTLRHAVKVRHARFRCPEFIVLLHGYSVATMIAGDGDSDDPQIADATADVAYLHIMGTIKDQPKAYSPGHLDA